ncbi:protein-tyrosine phosphatase-like protein [Flagelloscypha sp. PMI_526]|nr:protein-tyrosine phosphatase-like protein [Flagelloscypha sp. PMI_526]
MIMATPSIDCVLDNQVYLGNLRSALSAETLEDNQITHILSCINIPVTLPPGSWKHLQIEVEDSEYEDILIHFTKGVSFIEDAIRDNGRVLVHCLMGVSRSASVVSAYFMKKFQISPSEAISRIQARRSIIHPNYGFITQLGVFAACDYAPHAKHPRYIEWRRHRKEDVSRFLRVFCDVEEIIADEGEALSLCRFVLFRILFCLDFIWVLSSEFPSNLLQASTLLAELEVTHLLQVAPSKVPPNATKVLMGRTKKVLLNPEDPTNLCHTLSSGIEFLKNAYNDTTLGREPRVLVHCDIEAKGCTVVGAYLMSTRKLSVSSVIDYLSATLGPLFEPTRNLKSQLEVFYRSLQTETSTSPPPQIPAENNTQMIESALEQVKRFREAQAAEEGMEVRQDLDAFGAALTEIGSKA